jgi:hypothetical protein
MIDPDRMNADLEKAPWGPGIDPAGAEAFRKLLQ